MTGWTFEVVGALSSHEGSELLGYWDQHPPVHEMVAAYLGAGAKPTKLKHTTLEEARAAAEEMAMLN